MPALVGVLWKQLLRALEVTEVVPGERAPGAIVIRAVLSQPRLEEEEEAVLAAWREGGEDTRALLDHLLESRANRALQEGLMVEAERRGLELPDPLPRVVVRRGPGSEGDGDEEGARAAGPGKSGKTGNSGDVDILDLDGVDVGDWAPGEGIDGLVDLVLANQEAFDKLSVSLPADFPAEFRIEGDGLDTLLASPLTSSLQVVELERSLGSLEDLLREAIPVDDRPAGLLRAPSDDLSGELLGGKYMIKRKKGSGGFKTVYEAVDQRLGARVALAVLNPKHARSASALENFQKEAQQLTTLDHENIVRWITYDRTDDGLHYFVMEYLDGEELEELVRREGQLDPGRVASILLQIVKALRRAHRMEDGRTLLHLDLKPQNVFLLPPQRPDEADRVKVIDFGIGQHIGADIRAAGQPSEGSIFEIPPSELDKSIASVALPQDPYPEPLADGETPVQRARGGTLLYASPEQCEHLAGHHDIVSLDARSDLYSLGVTAFRMLTGEYPFPRCDTAMQAIRNHLEVPPRKVGSLGVRVPRKLAAFVDRCLEKDRDKRPADAEEAYRILSEIVDPPLPVRRILAAVFVLLVALTAAIWTQRPVPDRELNVAHLGGAPLGTVLLGATSPSLPLELGEVADGLPQLDGAQARVESASGELLSGWQATVDVAHGRLLLESSPDASERDSAPRQVRVVMEAGGNTWKSNTFGLVFVGPWEASVAVRGENGLPAPGRAIDPEGFELVVAVRTDGAPALRSLVLREEERIVLGPIAPLADDERAFAPVSLAGLGGAAGAHAFSVEVRDAADQVERTRLDLDLAAALPEPAFELVFADGTRVTPAGNMPVAVLAQDRLQVAATSPCTLTILDLADRPLRVEMLAPGDDFETTLGELELPPSKPGERCDLRWRLDDGVPGRRTPGGQLALVCAEVPRLELRTRFRAAGALPEAAETERTLADGVQLLGSRSFVLEVISRGEGALELELSTPQGEPSPASEVSIEPRHGSVARDEPFRAAFVAAQDGRFEVVLTCRAAGAEEVPGRFLERRAITVEIDTRPPSVELEPTFAAGGYVRIADAPGARLRFGADPDPSTLDWKLGSPSGSVQSGSFDRGLAFQDEHGAFLSINALFGREHLTEEGPWTLNVRGASRAGVATSCSLGWNLSTRGPRIEPLEPALDREQGTWTLPLDGAWPIAVRASDPNGVERVTARLVQAGVAGPSLELERIGDSERWELPKARRPFADPSQANQEVRVEVRAVDGAGDQSKGPEWSGFLPELAFEWDPVLVSTRRGSSARPELWVHEHPEGAYVFGAGARTGRRGESGWNISIPGGSLAAFYVQAFEVTRGEFLAFVRDPGGFLDAQHWPSGQAPTRARRDELESALDDPGRSGEPAVGITWAEATAYADGLGGRLPTLLEWEWLVRGGALGRRDTLSEPAQLARPTAAAGSTDPGGYPANLCAGPHEWTQTPERFTRAGWLEGPGTHFRKHRSLLCDPSAQPEAVAAVPGSFPTTSPPVKNKRWVVGGSAADRPGYRDVEVRKDDRAFPDVGFRCVLDAALVRSKKRGDEFRSWP